MTHPITLFNDRRGTASLEAVIMLPVMAICWASIFFFLKGFDNQLDAAVEARRKAWNLSDNACQSAERQYDCNGVGGSKNSEDSMGWLDSIGDLPIVGWMFGSVFGYSTKVHVIRDWSPPAMFGTATKRSSYDYQIMCNEEKADDDDDFLIRSVICEQIGDVGADFAWIAGIDCPDERHTGSNCEFPKSEESWLHDHKTGQNGESE